MPIQFDFMTKDGVWILTNNEWVFLVGFMLWPLPPVVVQISYMKRRPWLILGYGDFKALKTVWAMVGRFFITICLNDEEVSFDDIQRDMEKDD